ncbi:MAG: O-methyltransferase [Clostridiales bacterium]|nr:MAG: O-methyltransferase [Clostridiales bacterium]PWL98488.1 MAG: O-methyltransferase [Clostridiales bacterium]
MKYAASLVKLHIDERLKALRTDALARGIPVTDEETLNYLLLMLSASRPRRILEIGTAVGLSAAAMLLRCPAAHVTTIELEEERYLEAKQNFERFGISSRVTCYLGDAGEILSMMDGRFDFVFLDGPKAQYEKYLFDLKRLMPTGGVLFADDVLLYGWVSGEQPAPQKRHSIVDKLRGYLANISADEDFITSVLDVGDGVAVSVLTKEKDSEG